jgi:protein-S-isoprenylcysteine O-methyltransferase Ste14
VGRIIDLGERLFVVLLCIPFVAAFAAVLPTQPYLVLVTVSELLAATLIIFRKPGAMVLSPYVVAIAIIGTALPLLVRPGNAVELAPALVSSVLMFGGLALNISAKLWLNRSFGIVAANRGVKSGGPYRLVRHPMYLGYMATQVGFLLASFSVMNLCLYLVAWTAQILRIREEEKILGQDDAYLTMSRQVRFRLVPGLY